MPISIKPDSQFVLDQTAGTQTIGTDSDVAFSELAGLSTEFNDYLLGLPGFDPTFATLVGIGASDADLLTIDPDGELSGASLGGADGQPLDGLDSGLTTLEGDPILLFSVTDTIVEGRVGDASGDVVLALNLVISDNGDGTFSGQILSYSGAPLEHPDSPDEHDENVFIGDGLFINTASELSFDFGIPLPGQNLFGGFGNENAAIMVIAKGAANESEPGIDIGDGNTVNTNTQGVAVNSGNIVDGDGLVLTFVSGADADLLAPELNQNEADEESNIQFADTIPASGGSVTISKVVGSGSTNIKLVAYDTDPEPGDNFVDGLIVNDELIDITSVTVTDASGADVTGERDIDIVGGVATIVGVEQGDVIAYDTKDAHDRLLVENAGTVDGQESAPFRLGGATLDQLNTDQLELEDVIGFGDDGPDVSITSAGGTIVLDETDNDADDNDVGGLLADVSEDVSALFTISENAGTDGNKSATTVLTLSAPGADSGLIDSQTDEAVLLDFDGDEIVGSSATGGEVLRISYDATLDQIRVTQSRAVEHDDFPDDYDESTSPETINANVVGIERTITDGDDDQASATADLGPLIRLEDDGPVASLTIVGDPGALLDEDPDSGDESASFPNALAVATLDGSAIFDTTGSSTGSDFVIDGETFSLRINGGDGTDSGLVDTATKSAVLLEVEAATGDVVGSCR